MSDDKLLQLLDTLKEQICNNFYSEEQKEDIEESIQSFVDNDFAIRKDVLKYLFTGWWVHQQTNEMASR